MVRIRWFRQRMYHSWFMVNVPDGYNLFPFLQTDVAVDLGDACGVKTVKVPVKGGSTVHVPVFFGLKHPFGYMRKMGNGHHH